MLRGRLLCLLALGCLLHAGAAYGAPGDPEAGSPSGSVYELPLESARSDAAPGGGGTTAPAPASPDSGAGGGSTAEGEGGEGSSYYRSENNFGSSSEVPGTAKADNDPSGGGGGGGAGGGSGGGAASSDLTAQNTSAPVDTGNTSVGRNLALLAAIAALAAGLGALAMRRRSRTR